MYYRVIDEIPAEKYNFVFIPLEENIYLNKKR